MRYFLRRVLLTVPVLVGVATLVFALIHLVPGDPAESMLGEGSAPEEVAALLTVFPGFAIAALVLGINFLEDGLRDRLDPRRQEGRQASR